MQVNNKSKLQNRILVALIVIGVMVLALIALLRFIAPQRKLTRVYEYKESDVTLPKHLRLTKAEFSGNNILRLYGITDAIDLNNAVFYDADFNVLEGDYSASYKDEVYTVKAKFASRINHISSNNGNYEYRYLCSDQYALKYIALATEIGERTCYYGDYFTEAEKAEIQAIEQRIEEKYESLIGCFESADGDRIYFSDIDGEKHMELVYNDGIGYGVTITEVTEDETDPDVLNLRSTYYRGWEVERYWVRMIESDGEALTIKGPFSVEYKKISDVNERAFKNNFGNLAGEWKRIDDGSNDNGLEDVNEIEFTEDSILYNGSYAALVDLVVCKNNYKLYEGTLHDYFNNREEDYSYYLCMYNYDGIYITLSEDNNVMIYEECTDGYITPFATLMFERE